MLLNRTEFFLMNNPVRDLIQERYELPIFRRMVATDTHFDTALEIGCGNGNGTHLIKKHFNPRKIEAIDLDERMIRIAQNRNGDHSITFSVMDAARLDFPDDYFDIVFDFGIIHHIPNWRDCIRELARVCKDKSYVLIEELAMESFSGFPGIMWKKLLSHPYEDMFTFNEFENSLQETGFEIIQSKYLNPLGLLKHSSLAAKIKKSNSVKVTT